MPMISGENVRKIVVIGLTKRFSKHAKKFYLAFVKSQGLAVDNKNAPLFQTNPQWSNESKYA